MGQKNIDNSQGYNRKWKDYEPSAWIKVKWNWLVKVRVLPLKEGKNEQKIFLKFFFSINKNLHLNKKKKEKNLEQSGINNVFPLVVTSYLQCLNAFHRLECSISQRLNIVVIQRQQTKTMQIFKWIFPYARYFICI